MEFDVEISLNVALCAQLIWDSYLNSPWNEHKNKLVTQIKSWKGIVLINFTSLSQKLQLISLFSGSFNKKSSIINFFFKFLYHCLSIF